MFVYISIPSRKLSQYCRKGGWSSSVCRATGNVLDGWGSFSGIGKKLVYAAPREPASGDLRSANQLPSGGPEAGG
jgi:hypothetical protein